MSGRLARRQPVQGLTAASTGLLLAAWHVPGPASVLESVYGLALSAKTLLVLVALGLGGLTRFVLLRRLEFTASEGVVDRLLDSGRLRSDGGDHSDVIAAVRRATRLEIGVLVLSGLLTSAPTTAVADAAQLSESTIEREGDVNLELLAMPAEEHDDGLALAVDEPVVIEATFTVDSEPVASDRTERLLADCEYGATIEVDLEAAEPGTYATVQPLTDPGE